MNRSAKLRRGARAWPIATDSCRQFSTLALALLAFGCHPGATPPTPRGEAVQQGARETITAKIETAPEMARTAPSGDVSASYAHEAPLVQGAPAPAKERDKDDSSANGPARSDAELRLRRPMDTALSVGEGSSAAAPPAKKAVSTSVDTLNGFGALGMTGVGRGGAGYGAGMAAAGHASHNKVARRLAMPMAAQSALPGPQFNTEGYAHNADNPVHAVKDNPLSTFSIDVDTASYSNVRRFLRDGQRPPIDAVRIEELVNYFRYDYAAPEGDAPFAAATEVAAAPWNPKHRLLQIGLRARDIAQAAVPARNLVFLVDVSGSMQSEDKLPLLKRGLSLLVRQLRPQDRIALVVYAGASGLALASTPGNQQQRILSALDNLEAGGSTNGADGIELAYRIAQEQFVRGGVNRVVLATDGDFNVGVTNQGDLVRLIEKKRESGVFLTVLGFGTGNLKDSTMEMLADKGNGHYAYIDSIEEARKVLVREAGSTLVTVAKDVKLQIEWNPARVASYRLIGYENRVLADRDFNDDKKDAGEIGAGHTVTALYEVELVQSAVPAHAEVDPLKYQSERGLTAAAAGTELLTLKLRYKRPDADRSELISRPVIDRGERIDQASSNLRWAAAVASFGMLLRQSELRGQASFGLVRELAQSALGDDPNGDRRELLQLVERAAAMGIGG